MYLCTLLKRPQIIKDVLQSRPASPRFTRRSKNLMVRDRTQERTSCLRTAVEEKAQIEKDQGERPLCANVLACKQSGQLMCKSINQIRIRTSSHERIFFPFSSYASTFLSY